MSIIQKLLGGLASIGGLIATVLLIKKSGADDEAERQRREQLERNQAVSDAGQETDSQTTEDLRAKGKSRYSRPD